MSEDALAKRVSSYIQDSIRGSPKDIAIKEREISDIKIVPVVPLDMDNFKCLITFCLFLFLFAVVVVCFKN